MRRLRDLKSPEISNHISLYPYAQLLEGVLRPRTLNQNLSEFIGWPYLSTEFYTLPRPRRADSPREITETERPGRMRGPRDQKPLEKSNLFCIFSCLRGGSAERVDPGRRSKVFTNL